MVQEWHHIVSLSLKTFVHGQENLWHPDEFLLGEDWQMNVAIFLKNLWENHILTRCTRFSPESLLA